MGKKGGTINYKSFTMAEKEVRKKPTKKTTTKTAPKKAVAKRVTKTPAKKKATTTTTTRKRTTRTAATRKAPTPVAETQAYKRKNTLVLVSGMVVFVMVLGVSAVLGMSGQGAINIETRLAEIKEQATPEEREKMTSIPVKKSSLPDGGLVPSGVPDAPVVPPQSASTTDIFATSTDEVASTTSASEIPTDTSGITEEKPTASSTEDTLTISENDS